MVCVCGHQDWSHHMGNEACGSCACGEFAAKTEENLTALEKVRADEAKDRLTYGQKLGLAEEIFRRVIVGYCKTDEEKVVGREIVANMLRQYHLSIH